MYHYFVVVTKLPLTNAILLLLKSLSWHPSPFGGNGGFVASKIQRRISIDFSRHETDELCSKIPATMSQNFSRSCQLADSANRGITFATKLSAWNLWSEFWRFKKYSTSIVPSSFDHSLPSRIFSSKKSRVPVSISIDWLKDSLFWKKNSQLVLLQQFFGHLFFSQIVWSIVWAIFTILTILQIFQIHFFIS